MNRIGRWIICAAAFAFLLGLLPSITQTIEDFFVFTEDGVSVSERFVLTANSAIKYIEAYAWHIVVVYCVFLAFVIFLEGQNPDRTILWMLVLIFVPVFGFLLYIFVGPDINRLRKRRVRKSSAKYDLDKTPFSGAPYALQIGKMLHACCGADVLLRNDVKILINGQETFPAVEAAIASAADHIYMEFFIIRSDSRGKKISRLLRDAARRGVTVRVLYDAVGSFGIGTRFVSELEEAGVVCKSFMPVAMPVFRRRMNFRNHRKIIAIDDAVAFTGGINIGAEYEGLGRLGFWRDTFVRVEGEAVAAMSDIFINDWQTATGETLPRAQDAASKDASEYGNLPVVPIQVASSGADNLWHAVKRGYYGMISRASRNVFVTSPYLVPGPELMNALISAALSGVDVRVMTPAKRDHFLVYWGSRSNIEPLLRAGVRVFLYEKGFIHAKTLTADGAVASVGTCNMDVRSLEINFENQLFIYDAGVARAFERQFEEDMADCRELRADDWAKRPFTHKLLESFGRLYSAQI